MDKLQDQITKMLEDSKKLAKIMEETITDTETKIDSLEDEDQKAFLKESLKMARTGELKTEDFMNQFKNIFDAS